MIRTQRMCGAGKAAVTALALLGAACVAESVPEEAGYDPREADGAHGAIGAAALPDVRCSTAPAAGSTKSWRHFSSRLIALGSVKHRGLDLVTSSSSAEQVLRGEISYGPTDKALEDEWVDVFACRAGAWQRVGSALTDDEGGFALTLRGTSLLPIGMRDLFVSVQGDRTGVYFLGVVAEPGAALAVSDVDGTLTSSENAFATSLVTGANVGIHAGAPTTFTALVAKGYQPVYLTARGDVFTGDTRAWLAAKGMPRGPLRLAPSLITLPGDETVDYKAGVLSALRGAGLDVAVGIGNRASDVAAYRAAGLGGERAFVKLPEYAGELQVDLDAGRATGFAAYDALTTIVGSLPQR